MEPRPGELLITRLPNRTGLYLAVQKESNRTVTLARFAGDGEWSSKEFVDALVAAGFQYRGEEKEEEGTDGELRSEAGQAGE